MSSPNWDLRDMYSPDEDGNSDWDLRDMSTVDDEGSD
jgi:hypothetical protein